MQALRFVLLLIGSLAWQTSHAALVIDISYSGDPAYQSAFNSAKSTWESLLTGYQDGKIVFAAPGSSYSPGQTLSHVFINANVAYIDGAGGTLGQAGYTHLALDTSGYRLATNGVMQFDSADVEGVFGSGNFTNLVLHEMAHVLGFGTLWSLNNKYVAGSGEFTGLNATAAWQSEFGQLGTPDVELGGGAGTAGGHWNEVNGGGGLTGITDSFGRDMRDELMTGWLNPNSFISDMTVASFVDIGFTRAVAVPEPSSVLLCSVIAVGVIARRGIPARSRLARSASK